MIAHIEPKQLKEWIDANEAVLVDVREPGEFRAVHIEGATLLPLSKVAVKKLPPHEGKKLVILCHSGKRGNQACKKLAAEDPSLQLYNLIGGMMYWEQTGFTVIKAAPFFLPMDRQAQLAIGLCVFVASLLAYFVDPAFLLVTGFFGLGLCFAGITGFCGLARLLAWAPWNAAESAGSKPPSACGI
jgi:rhodanese-related sulfurtransferase